MSVVLRDVVGSDLDRFFAWQQDPVALWMAAFVSADLASRAAFDARWSRILADPEIIVRSVQVDHQIVGQVLKYQADGHPELSYWFDRSHWGHGYATAAVQVFLAEYAERPIFARVVADNHGSVTVLKKCGFVVVGHDRSPAAARGHPVSELVLRHD